MRIRNLLVASAAAIVATGTIAGASVLTASAAPRAAATEHFQILQLGNSPDDVVFYAGPIIGHAIDRENGSNTVSIMKFSNGTITIDHPVKGGSQHFDPKTCLGVLSLHGTFKITKGTGAYKGVTGSGKYTTDGLFIAARVKGACSMKAAPVASHVVVTASGSVHL